MHTTNSVSDVIAQKAFVAIEGHPLYLEAKAKFHCVSDVYERSKDFIDRTKFSEEEKKLMHKELANVSTILLVSYFTADVKPEPLSGYGKLYAFIVHPESFALIQVAVGNWRS